MSSQSKRDVFFLTGIKWTNNPSYSGQLPEFEKIELGWCGTD